MLLCLGAGVLHVLARREAMDLQQLFFGQFVGRGLLSWLWVFLGLMQQSDRDDEDEDECCYGTGFETCSGLDAVVMPFSLIHGTVSLELGSVCNLQGMSLAARQRREEEQRQQDLERKDGREAGKI